MMNTTTTTTTSAASTTTTMATAADHAGAAAAKVAPTIGELVFNMLIFGFFTAISLAFGYYLLTDPNRLTEAWTWIRSLPLFVQLVMWALLLPYMIALWVWSLPWAFGVRAVLVVAIVLFCEYLLFPWKK